MSHSVLFPLIANDYNFSMLQVSSRSHKRQNSYKPSVPNQLLLMTNRSLSRYQETGKHKAFCPEDFPMSENLTLQLQSADKCMNPHRKPLHINDYTFKNLYTRVYECLPKHKMIVEGVTIETTTYQNECINIVRAASDTV